MNDLQEIILLLDKLVTEVNHSVGVSERVHLVECVGGGVEPVVQISKGLGLRVISRE